MRQYWISRHYFALDRTLFTGPVIFARRETDTRACQKGYEQSKLTTTTLAHEQAESALSATAAGRQTADGPWCGFTALTGADELA